ncbi:MAG: nuclear transport factor 2 family protein [Nitrospirota bacterium]
MTTGLRIQDLTLEKQGLWQRVNDLWALSLTRNATEIRNTLHPRYVGWDISSPTPHDREFAVQSVLGNSPVVTQYQLTPLSVEVYEHTVGIVHYAYSATVAPREAAPRHVTGKWTEIYLKQDRQWVMIGVSGRPDQQAGACNVSG